MPNCFQLTRIGASSPSKLQDIDAELCVMLGVEVHPKYWVAGWYDIIGFALATGVPLNGSKDRGLNWRGEPRFRSMDEVIEDNAELVKILAYLRANYTEDAWAEIGRK